MLLEEELDVTQIPMYLFPSKELHEAILLGVMIKKAQIALQERSGCQVSGSIVCKHPPAVIFFRVSLDCRESPH